MPGGDRTGPRGLGPMTGRGLGDCSNTSNTGNTFFGGGFGRGMGFGRGRGFGFRNFFNANRNTDLENEVQSLKDKISSLEQELKNR